MGLEGRCARPTPARERRSEAATMVASAARYCAAGGRLGGWVIGGVRMRQVRLLAKLWVRITRMKRDCQLMIFSKATGKRPAINDRPEFESPVNGAKNRCL